MVIHGSEGGGSCSRSKQLMATIIEAISAQSTGGPDLYRMTVEEYERLAAAGILKDPRVELIDGYLVRKVTKKPDHVLAVEGVRDALLALNLRGWRVLVQDPVRIPDFDEPEPDIAVARGSRRDYQGRHPGPADLALVVEVADSSLSIDRGPKLAAYAHGGIPCYWVVNLVEGHVEVFTRPDPSGRYLERRLFRAEETIPLSLDGRDAGQIAVGEILP